VKADFPSQSPYGYVRKALEEGLLEIPERFDAIWIGGGAAGRFGAVFHKQLGCKPLLVENISLGGECPRCRCAFDNFIFDVASTLELLRMYSGKGPFPDFKLPDKLSMARACELYRNVGRKAFTELMEFQTVIQLRVPVVFGEATDVRKRDGYFEVDVKCMDGKTRTFEGKNVVIATGSRPAKLNVPGEDLEGVMTYRDHPELTRDPERLVVVGGGRIGVSKAMMFRAFGVDVTIVEATDAILGEFDRDVVNFALSHLKRRGVEVYTKAKVKEIGGAKRVEGVRIEREGEVIEVPCDAVLVATGLVPNSELAVKWLGVKTGPRNEIVVNERMQTSVEGVYAVGDVVGPPYFMAIARKRGMVAAKNMAGIEAKIDYSYVPLHVYVPPYELCQVGPSEEELKAKYGKLVKIQVPVGPTKEIEPCTWASGIPGQALPVCDRMMTINNIYYGRGWHGFLKCLIDPSTRRYVGFYHAGHGAKVAFQYLSYFLKIGWTVDQMAELNEIFLNAEHFIQLTRLLAGAKDLRDLA